MLKTLLPAGSPRRTWVFSIATFAALLVFTQIGLPKNTPGGVIVYALVKGSQAALLAGGIILIYRTSKVINFSQGVLGGAGAAMMFNLAVLLEWPFLAALFVGLATVVLVGMIIELAFIQRFFNSPRLVLTVVTIVMASALGQARALIDGLPIFPNKNDPIISRKIQSGKIETLPFKSLSIDVFPFKLGFPEVFSLSIAVLAFVGLWAFLRFSKMGKQVRGTSENSDRALMLGINVRLLSNIVWGLSALLAGLAAISQGMVLGFTGAGSWKPEELLPALAAAVIGRMKNLPLTIFTVLGITILREAVAWSYPETTVLDLVMLVVITVGLYLQRKEAGRSDQEAASSWEATKELRPTPKELTAVPGIRRLRRALILLGLVALIVFPLASSPAQTNLAGLIAIYVIVALSLVVLTGWGGQVSLGQFAFVGVAALVGGKLTSDVNVPFWIALPLVCAFTGVFAALVGLPALRIKGAFLTVTTLAFAIAVQSTLFNEAYFGWLIPDRVERPTLLILSFGNEQNYYYLTVFFALMAAIVVKRLRASRPGRILLAVREDEQGVQAFGVNVVRTKVAVFALSGSLAGLAGMLFVHHQRAVDAGSFTSQVSIDMFLMAMIGGITSVSGAILGAIYIGLVRFFLANPVARQLSTSLGLLFLLVVSPGGLAALAYQARDGVLRIVAARRQMIVPSLFENFDPAALARRKIPFAPRQAGEGLDAIPQDKRYAIASELYPKTERSLVPAGTARGAEE